MSDLLNASKRGNLARVHELIKEGADVNDEADSTMSMSPLHFASQGGHVEVVKTLLAAEAEVNKANKYGNTPLSMASRNGHLEVVQALLGADAEVNKANKYGNTPLSMASRNGHLEVVKALLGAEADVNKANNCRVTPLHWASSMGTWRWCRLCWARGQT